MNKLLWFLLMAISFQLAGCKSGCTDPDALNYDASARFDNNSCEFPDVLPRDGCMDCNATNYDSLATDDDGSCSYLYEQYIGTFTGTDSIYSSDSTLITQNHPISIIRDSCGTTDVILLGYADLVDEDGEDLRISGSLASDSVTISSGVFGNGIAIEQSKGGLVEDTLYLNLKYSTDSGMFTGSMRAIRG